MNLNCYSCEYRQYKHGNQTPGSKCPSNCTIRNLLGGFATVYQSLSPDQQKLIIQRFPPVSEILELFNEIIANEI